MSRIDKNYPTDKGSKGSKGYPESKDPTDRKWPLGWKYPHLPGINEEKQR